MRQRKDATNIYVYTYIILDCLYKLLTGLHITKTPYTDKNVI
jgi:hypothetical protein